MNLFFAARENLVIHCSVLHQFLLLFPLAKLKAWKVTFLFEIGKTLESNMSRAAANSMVTFECRYCKMINPGGNRCPIQWLCIRVLEVLKSFRGPRDTCQCPMDLLTYSGIEPPAVATDQSQERFQLTHSSLESEIKQTYPGLFLPIKNLTSWIAPVLLVKTNSSHTGHVRRSLSCFLASKYSIFLKK